MRPQNMAHWHIDYFKVKGFEKQHVQEGLSDLPRTQVIKPSCESHPPYTWRKGALLSLKKRDTEESEQTVLANFPPVYYN